MEVLHPLQVPTCRIRTQVVLLVLPPPPTLTPHTLRPLSLSALVCSPPPASQQPLSPSLSSLSAHHLAVAVADTLGMV